MKPDPELEARLRRGLGAAAAELDPAPTTPATEREWWEADEDPPGASHRVLTMAVALVAVLVLGAALLARPEGSDPVTPAGTTAAPTTLTQTQQLESVIEAQRQQADLAWSQNGMVPGRAVVVGNLVRLFDREGRPAGERVLTSFGLVSAISSDLAGGWVACGTVSGPNVGGSLWWFPAGRDPVRIEAPDLSCSPSAVRVVPTSAGPAALYVVDGSSPPHRPHIEVRALSTGERRPAPDVDPLDLVDRRFRWSATGDRFAYTTGDDLHVLAPGQPEQVFPLPFGQASVARIVLDANSESVAAIVGRAGGDYRDGELIVYHLRTRTVLFREAINVGVTADIQLSYDGTTLAVDGEQPSMKTVIDVATGTRRTLHAYGLLG